MDKKVIIDVICPYCNSKLTLNKKVEVSSKTITCPGNGCGKKLHILFDTTREPQTYEIADEPEEKIKGEKDETIYKKKENLEKGAEQEGEKKKTVYGKDKHNTPHNIYNDIDDDDDDEKIKPKKRHRLRERIYRTHITWFGLRRHNNYRSI